LQKDQFGLAQSRASSCRTRIVVTP
jgi:hypothetical protein